MSSDVVRIALIHALRASVEPIQAAFELDAPQVELVHLLDDSLSTDLRRRGYLDDDLFGRFDRLADYVVARGVDAILFTCSAFGPCIEGVARRLAPMPVRKPNEAMIAEAIGRGGPVALLATFAPTLQSMPAEFPGDVEVVPIFVEGALDALVAGDALRHDRLIANAAERCGIDTVVLAQFSMARAAPLASARLDRSVLTTPSAAVRELVASLEARSGNG